MKIIKAIIVFWMSVGFVSFLPPVVNADLKCGPGASCIGAVKTNFYVCGTPVCDDKSFVCTVSGRNCEVYVGTVGQDEGNQDLCDDYGGDTCLEACNIWKSGTGKCLALGDEYASCADDPLCRVKISYYSCVEINNTCEITYTTKDSGCCVSDGVVPTPDPTPDETVDPTPEPVVSCANAALAGPATLYVGDPAQTYTATATITNANISRVEFRTDTSSIVSPDVWIDGNSTGGFTDDVLGLVVGSTTITASIYDSVTNTIQCTATKDVEVVLPTVTVTANTYEAASPVDCSSTTRIANPTVSLTSFADVAGNPAVFNNVPGGGTSYNLGVSLDPEWTYVACGANPRSITVNNAPVVEDFYYVRQADPWYQVVGGDAGALASLTVNVPWLKTATMAYGLYGPLSEGALIASNSVVNGGNGLLGKWQVEGSGYAQLPSDDYLYFMRLFEMRVPTDEVPDTISNFNDIQDLDTQVIFGDGSVSLFNDGPLTVDGLTVADGVARTIFVDGDLEVTDDIIVPLGGFLAWVVNGNVTIDPDVTGAQGVYIADGVITVDGYGTNDVQFVGEGTFVGWGGITLSRDLSGADPLANNDDPAEQFVYRPDFLINAPEGFLRSGIEWAEVAPTGQGEGQ